MITIAIKMATISNRNLRDINRFDVMSKWGFRLLKKLRAESKLDLCWACEKYYNPSDEVFGPQKLVNILFVVFREATSYKCTVYGAIESYVVNEGECEKLDYQQVAMFDMGQDNRKISSWKTVKSYPEIGISN